MVWNVQGTGNKKKINAIKEVVRIYKPTVLALVETHMGEEHAIKMGTILGYNGQSRVNAIGFSGGIWLYWRKEINTLTPITEHQQFITVEIPRNGELPWFFSAVYASPDPTNRRQLWVELENFARNNNRPWLLAGDFNETRSLRERHGGDQNMARRCENFDNWIENCEFLELAFTGPSHTWARGNSVATRQSARLDRALCNADWGALFEDAMTWNAEIFGNIFKQKKNLLARIEGCQRSLALGRKSNIIKLEANLRRELDEILAREELLWYQKSRLEFIKDGDRNTAYFHEFNTRDWEWLTKPFTMAEIENVISYMGALKAPGPDGFQALFYQKNWGLIAPSLCSMVINVLEGKGMPTSLNDTHLVLIPKVDTPEFITQFRPISLCNVAYKIISKALANRIKRVLPHVISETQSGFVPGRQITDNIVIFQEAIHSMRKKKGKTGIMAIKIDLEKAYDRLRCDFIHATLSDMNFPGLLIDVLMECVRSPRMQILWNGEPTEQFTPSREVRQGDPLSSYLFVMCLEKLQQAIDYEVRNNNWHPIVSCRNGPHITNLFFADDMVLFAEATEEQALLIKNVLENFCKVSGEKVSAPKSKIFFSSNTEGTTRIAVRDILEFEETDDLGTYLGVPTINGRVNRHTFSHLEERVNRRLAGWSTKRLSLAGRATLVKSTLNTIANYNMQSAKIPRSVCDSIDRKSRRFLWGGDEDKKSIHLVSWENIQKPKSIGGLGIMSARQANAAFLTKLGWRVLTERSSLWSQVLRAKYCNNRCDIDIFQPKNSMSNVWAGITSQSRTIVRGASMVIGNGRRHGWNWDSFSNFLPQELLQKIASISLVDDPDLEDSLYWKGTSSGKFSISSALGFLKELDYSTLPESLIWRTIWRIPVQQRVRMFLWLAAHGRLMVNVNRVVRNMGDDPMCPRCNEFEETTDHLLRACPYSKRIWDAVGINSMCSDFYAPSFLDWLTKNASNEVTTSELDWPILFALTCWWILKWRNNIVFGRDNENPTLPGSFLYQQLEWSKKAFDKFNIFIPQQINPNVEVFIRWLPPPHGWILLNTDGASKGNPGPAGGGGIFRDETGNFLSAYYFSCGSCTSMKAEFLALLAGLKRAKALRLSRLLIHMDNSNCVKIINEEQLVSNSMKFIVKQCQELIQDELWEVKLDHTYREANRAADLLANQGVFSSTIVSFLEAPIDELRPILREDIFGVAIPRVIASS
ncbi:uncharacterized protein LOC141614562 [Silene latifolia]|uniref:uncharacterized protein LOC141614562 n=1 Tax=Silene latifolia TaxID=37657 RepID=UPI003D787DF2